LDRIWDPTAHGSFAAAARGEAKRPERQPEAIVGHLLTALEALINGRNTVC
jgi:hypothetical protein